MPPASLKLRMQREKESTELWVLPQAVNAEATRPCCAYSQHTHEFRLLLCTEGQLFQNSSMTLMYSQAEKPLV